MVVFRTEEILFLEARRFFGQYLLTENYTVNILLGLVLSRCLITIGPTWKRWMQEKRQIYARVVEYVRNCFGKIQEKGAVRYQSIGFEAGMNDDEEDEIRRHYRGQYEDAEEVQAVLGKLSGSPTCQMEKARWIAATAGEKQPVNVADAVTIEVDKNIFCDVKSEEIQLMDGLVCQKLSLKTLKIYSPLYTGGQLRERIKSWVDECRESKRELHLTLARFSPDGCDRDEMKFHTSKSFAKCYFEHKERILSEINFFLNNREWYETRGLPYSMGILLYGEPGCGKTSFVKSLLKYAKRDGFLFSLNEFTDLREVEKEMLQDQQKDDEDLERACRERRVFILEDVDAMGDVVHKRKRADSDISSASNKGLKEGGADGPEKALSENHEEELERDKPEAKTKYAEEQANNRERVDVPIAIASMDSAPPEAVETTIDPAETTIDPSKTTLDPSETTIDPFSSVAALIAQKALKKLASSNPKLLQNLKKAAAISQLQSQTNLSAFLNLLDGVLEYPGRILVMTTNHLDRLDPALIRPGRVDLAVEFKRCSRKIMKEMVSDFFLQDPNSWELPSSIEDYLLTPARVAQVCRCNAEEFDTCLSMLKAEAQIERLQREKMASIPRNPEDAVASLQAACTRELVHETASSFQRQ